MMNFIEDETSYLQYGQYEEKVFFDYMLHDAIPSSWIYWPTKDNPSSLFKYMSAEFNMSIDRLNWSRSTYSILDYLGDLGGLLDMLIAIAGYIVAPMASYRLETTLLQTFFRFRESDRRRKVSNESGLG